MNTDGQPPISLTGLRFEAESKTYAAGPPALINTAKHVFGALPVYRGLKTLFNLNQKQGIDCPSCAWPDPDGHRSALGEYCENGAKAIADEATARAIRVPFFQKYSIADLVAKSDFWLGQQGRLTSPMVLRPGARHYEPITWQESFGLIAKNLNNLENPDQAIFYTSGRSSNEAAFLYQLFVRAFGTNNLPDCSNMCHESSGVALSQTIGIGKGTVTLADFEKAEVIMIMGQNPGTNHPRMLSSLEKAKKNGAKIVAINPLFEAGLLGFKNPQKVSGLLGKATSIADLYLQVKINGDLALTKAILKILIEKAKTNPNIFDQKFIAEKTDELQSLIIDLEAYSINDLIQQTGLQSSEIYALADLLAVKKKIIICWAMGLTQHKNSVATIRELVNLVLFKGSIGKEGAGLCPVRGHSNVQGDRTMGISTLPTAHLKQALFEKYNIEVSDKQGLDTIGAIQAMAKGTAKVFVALGGNFLSASPDTTYTAAALQNCNLTVHISTKLNRSHLVTGKTALILPCLGRTDKDASSHGLQYLSTENSMGVVQKTQGILEPVSEQLLGEPTIVAMMADCVLAKKVNINWLAMANDYSLIRAEIEKVIEGFAQYEQKLAQSGGFYLPNAPRTGSFNLANGKAKFSINLFEKLNLHPDAFLMMTIRSHDQFNTTVYGLNDRYRGIYNERRIVMMNEADMIKKELKTYDIVNLFNRTDGVQRQAVGFIVVPYRIPQGCIATYFPEANVLVPLSTMADESRTPTSKSVEVFVEKNDRRED